MKIEADKFSEQLKVCKKCGHGEIICHGAMGLKIFGSVETIHCDKIDNCKKFTYRL